MVYGRRKAGYLFYVAFVFNNKQGLLFDGTAINWSVESAPVTVQASCVYALIVIKLKGRSMFFAHYQAEILA